MEEKVISRADFFKESFNILFKHIGKAVKKNAREKAARFMAPLIRPPGAVEELSFLARCTRCDRCAEACPFQAIVKAGTVYGVAMGTPIINPKDQPCRMCEDFPCIRACLEKALVTLPHRFYKIGTARVIPSRCFAHNGQVCDYCYDYCPGKGEAIAMEQGKPVVTESKCTGCGICEFFCPASAPGPGKAIQILPLHNGSVFNATVKTKEEER